MMKYTKHSLSKIETLFKELGYLIRYEKGNFQSGYCIVENKKVAIINRFFDTEARINCLIDILNNLEVEEATLSKKSLKLYQLLQQDLSS